MSAIAGPFGILSIGSDIVPVTPSDTVNLPQPARVIRCRPDGAAGTLRITTVAGQVRNTYIAAGGELLIATLRVHATGTTATNLEAII
jgi:hypothetical protein